MYHTVAHNKNNLASSCVWPDPLYELQSKKNCVFISYLHGRKKDLFFLPRRNIYQNDEPRIRPSIKSACIYSNSMKVEKNGDFFWHLLPSAVTYSVMCQTLQQITYDLLSERHNLGGGKNIACLHDGKWNMTVVYFKSLLRMMCGLDTYKKKDSVLLCFMSH